MFTFWQISSCSSIFPPHHVMNTAFLLSLSNLNVLRPQSASGIKVQQYLHKKYRFLSAVLCLITQLCPTLWTVAHQAPLSMGFSRKRILERVFFYPFTQYWVLPSPPGDLPNPRIEPRSPALQVLLYCLSYQWRARKLEWVLLHSLCYRIIKKKESQAQSFPTTQEILSFSRVLSIEKLTVYAGSDTPGFLPCAWGIRVPAYLKPLTLRENISL